MTRAYSEIYLYDAMKNLGEAVDYCISACNLNPKQFTNIFLASKYSSLFATGAPSVVSGMSGTELVQNIIADCGITMDFPNPQTDFFPNRYYWAGWITAYFQWHISKDFAQIFRHISLEEIIGSYNPLHEASEDKAVEVFSVILKERSEVTKLQQFRRLMKYTQAGLSKESGVSLRAIQQYEQRVKNINKASADSVTALARVLKVQPSDLME